MKITNYIYVLLFVITTLSVSSCGQQGKNQSVHASTNSLKAAINGKAYKAVHVTGFISTIPNTLLLTGAMGTGEDIQLILPKEITPGVYPFEDLLVQGKYQQDEESAGFAIRGAVTITTHDVASKKIEGIFDFTTKPIVKENPSFDITRGTFKIAY
ncbi:DUF6252 family protein [uncultured Dokdonia sp.]|uniref:DUF6252 family protein n=1 Tax=uncultured Dokdonia sp. TaxID=575653 RepID=UPI0026210F45|nr:DUF6252 family protein [uncultured Dokdonia sp.]